MKISIITHNFPSADGSGRDAGGFVFDFSLALVEAGHSVSVLCPSIGPPFKPAPFEVRNFEYFKTKQKLSHLSLFNPSDACSLLSLLRKGCAAATELAREVRPDLMFAMWVVPSGFLALRAKRLTGIPYAVWALGSDLNIYAKKPVVGWLARRVLQNASIRFADGKALCSDVERIAQTDCHFLPSGLFPIEPEGDLFTKPDDRMHFLFVGRLEKVKGVDILLEAMQLLSDEKGKFLVHVVGDGSFRPLVEQFLSSSPMAEFLVFHGTVDDRWLRYFLHGSDYLVIPSRSESVPLVLSEAMQSGLPVLAAKVGDLSEIVRAFNIGCLFEPESPSSLAESIRNALNEGKAAREKYQPRMAELAEVFDIRRSAGRFLEIVQGKQIQL